MLPLSPLLKSFWLQHGPAAPLWHFSPVLWASQVVFTGPIKNRVYDAYLILRNPKGVAGSRVDAEDSLGVQGEVLGRETLPLAAGEFKPPPAHCAPLGLNHCWQSSCGGLGAAQSPATMASQLQQVHVWGTWMPGCGSPGWKVTWALVLFRVLQPFVKTIVNKPRLERDILSCWPNQQFPHVWFRVPASRLNQTNYLYRLPSETVSLFQPHGYFKQCVQKIKKKFFFFLLNPFYHGFINFFIWKINAIQKQKSLRLEDCQMWLRRLASLGGFSTCGFFPIM